MGYQRVLPRDLFNEAKLLKCIGHLCLQIHDQKVDDLEFEQSGFDSYGSEVDGFDIELKEDLNGLYISNIEFTKPSNGRLLNFYTTYNSKASYPLF